jgi:hypothetical protein
VPQPAAVHAIGDDLVRAYERAWRRVLAEQQAILDNPLAFRRRARLEEMSRAIGRIMDDLDAKTAEWLAKEFPRIYLAGLSTSTAALVWTAIHQAAVEELGYGIFSDLLDATRYVRESTKALIRSIAQREAEFALIGGDTAQGAGRTLARALERKGVGSILYRNGARHGLYDYAEMNMRTTTALAYNRGTLNAAPEVVWWEVFDGPGCGWSAHNDGEQALGKIVTRDEALAFPIAHPRCRRAFGARPDVKSKQDILDLGKNPLTVGAGQTTVGQRAAQIAQDRTRTPRGTRTPRQDRGARTPRRAA